MAAHLGWKAEKDNTCSCGQPIDESMAPGMDDAYQTEIVVCHSCADMDRKERQYREGGGDMAGIKRNVWLRDVTP